MAVEKPAPASLAVQLGEALLRDGRAEGMLACDSAGGVSFCNAAAARVLRTTRAKAEGANLAALLDPLPDTTLKLRFLSALRDRASIQFVVARPARADEWVEVRGLPIAGGMAFLLKDVTDQERGERTIRRKEQRLRAANESLRLAHQAARAATWEWRAGQSLRWLDIAAARALVGLSSAASAEEDIADWRTFVLPQDMPAVSTALKGLRGADEVEFEYRVAGANGHAWLRSSAAVVERLADGAPGRVSGVTLDVTSQKNAEAKLQREIQERVRAEEHQQLLIHELNHRVKNMLATVQSVARQSLSGLGAGSARADFEDRLMALAWTHDILTKERWAGASLLTIVERTLAPHVRDDRVAFSGPDLRLTPKMALALAMGLHELATNAVKYGALANDSGRVCVDWRVDTKGDGARLVVDWREQGGPPVAPPLRRGFGSRLLERGLAGELGGPVVIAFEPAGVSCRIDAPLEAAPPETDPRSGPGPRSFLGDRPGLGLN